MDQNTWNAIDPQLDEIAEELEKVLWSKDCEKLRGMLTRLAKSLPPNLAASFECEVTICDSKREACLPILNLGLGITESGEMYPTSGTSSALRYVVEGEIQVVPNDICPKCYGIWDNKFEIPHCDYCDAHLGVNCWALLDSDVCPFCEDGQITAQKPSCTKCGFVVDPKLVKWG